MMAKTATDVTSIGEAQHQLAQLVRQRPELRSEFIADPKSALAKQLSLTVGDVQLVAVADTVDAVHVVVPYDRPEFEEDGLDGVGGGFCNVNVFARRM